MIFLVSLDGRQSFTKTFKPVMELKVKEKKKSTLQTSEDTQMEQVEDATTLEEESKETSGWR